MLLAFKQLQKLFHSSITVGTPLDTRCGLHNERQQKLNINSKVRHLGKMVVRSKHSKIPLLATYSNLSQSTILNHSYLDATIVSLISVFACIRETSTAELNQRCRLPAAAYDASRRKLK